MGSGKFKNLGLKMSTNAVYRRILLLLGTLFVLLTICYGFLIYQARAINLEQTERYTVYQERELYLSKFYNSLNKNELIQELYTVTQDKKYLQAEKDNFSNMQQEFDSLYWHCQESDDYCLRLDTSKFFLDMYINKIMPEYDSIISVLSAGEVGSIGISEIHLEMGELEVDTVWIHSREKGRIKRLLDVNRKIIEQRIVEPIQVIARSDKYASRANKELLETKVQSYNFWQKIVAFLAAGLMLLLGAVLVFIMIRPLEKPQPVYHALPDQQYSSFHDGFERELTEILEKQKKLFIKYDSIVMIFPRGSFFPIEIISAFQNFCQANNISFMVRDKLKTETLSDQMAFVLLEDETMAVLVEAISSLGLEVGKQVGILGYSDSPLKRIVAGGISVIDTLFEECKHTGTRSAKAANSQCLRFVKRNSL